MFEGLQAVGALVGSGAAEEFRAFRLPATIGFLKSDVVKDPPGEIVRLWPGRYRVRVPDRAVLVPGWLNEYVEAVNGGKNAEGSESIENESGRSPSV